MKTHLRRFFKGVVVLGMIPGSLLGIITLNRFLVSHTGADLVTWTSVAVISLGGTYSVGYMVERFQTNRKKAK